MSSAEDEIPRIDNRLNYYSNRLTLLLRE